MTDFTPRLTLSALSEIERGLGCTSLAELAIRLKRLSARDVVFILEAALRGDGADPAIARRKAAALDPQAAFALLTRLLTAALAAPAAMTGDAP